MNSLWGLKQDFILASASPERRKLLEMAGFYPAKIISADIDETPLKNELPLRYVARIATLKAQDIAKKNPGTCVLAADTVIAVGKRIIRKAQNEQEAVDHLKLISGRRHRVITGFCIIAPNGKAITKTVTTAVVMKKLDEVDIRAVIKSNEWVNVSGYQIEGVLSALVRKTIGSYPNVVGLPIFEVAQVLRGIL